MIRHAIHLVLLSCIAYSASGCALAMMQGAPKSCRGWLDDAAAQARADTARSRFPAARRTEPAARRLDAGMSLGGGSLNAAGYDGFGAFALNLGGYPCPEVRLDGLVTYNEIDFKPESVPGTTFRDQLATDVGIDLIGRYYLSRDADSPGMYPLAGLGVGTMFWDYLTPVASTGPGAPGALSHDGVFYTTVFAGAGARLLRSQFINADLNVVWGVRVYGAHLGSESENGQFRSVGYSRVLLELNRRVR